MEVIQAKQGTPEWHQHRANHFNASDTPAVMGLSKYKSRDELLHEIKTGITPEVDSATQKRFDEGHRIEALARPLAEAMIDDGLSPIVGTSGKFSASFDGITFDSTTTFEHKTLNDDLRNIGDDYKELPKMYLVQIEHQFMVSGAETCIFMASKWDGNELLEKREWMVQPNKALRGEIVAAWEQFEKDLEDYTPPVEVEKVEAKQSEVLQLPSVVVKGEVVESNLDAITPMFDKFLEGINTTLSTDQDFANAETDSKDCRKAESNIKALRTNVIAQIASINKIDTELGNYQEAFRKAAIQLENAIKEQKKAIKSAAVLKAKQDYQAHLDSLRGLVDINLSAGIDFPDFASATKNKKTVASMQSSINDALAQAKASASTVANEVAEKLEFILPNIKEHKHLFRVEELVWKDTDYIKLHIENTIEQEKRRQEALVAKVEPVVGTVESKTDLPQAKKKESVNTMPSAHEIIQAVANTFAVDKDTALGWLSNLDFSEKKVA